MLNGLGEARFLSLHWSTAVGAPAATCSFELCALHRMILWLLWSAASMPPPGSNVTSNPVQPYVMNKAVYNPAAGAMDLSAAGTC